MGRNKRTGDKSVKVALRTLRHWGYRAAEVERKGKNIRGPRDLFGLFDIVAVHPTHAPLLLQVTTNRPHPHKPYEEFAAQTQGISTYQWVRVVNPGRKPDEWRLIQYDRYDGGKRSERRCPSLKMRGMDIIDMKCNGSTT